MPSRKHPKLYDVVLQAMSNLQDIKGSSVSNIIDLVRCAINDNNVKPRPRNVSTLVRSSLKHGVQMGHLEQRSGRYKIRVNSSSMRRAITGPRTLLKTIAHKTVPAKKRPKRKRDVEVISRPSTRSGSRSRSRSGEKQVHKRKMPRVAAEHPAEQQQHRYQTRSRTAQQRVAQEVADKPQSKSLPVIRPRTNRDGTRADKLKVRKVKASSAINRKSRPIRKYSRQGEPSRRGASHQRDFVDYKWANINPFSFSKDWGVDEDDDGDSNGGKGGAEGAVGPDDNPEPLLEPHGSDEDLAPDGGEVMADENRPDTNDPSENTENSAGGNRKDGDDCQSGN